MNDKTMIRVMTAVAAVVSAIGCSGGDKREGGALADRSSVPTCPATDLILPDGFCATVFADSLGHPRHLTVSSDGTVYVNTWSGRYYGNDQPPAGGFLIALRDTNGDGRADVMTRFGDSVQSGGAGGTGIALYQSAIYAEANDKVVRYPLPAGSITPTGAGQVVLSGLPLTGDHPMHPFAIDSSGALYINSGSATNACQRLNRIADSRGRQPCTELTTRGGIWRYDARATGQRFSPGERYASGIRNSGGIAVDSTGRGLYATQHGRDQLAENWPRLYSPVEGQNFPAEELLRVEQNGDYGWPECYFDSAQVKLVLAPEYGGDGGKAVGVCATRQAPIAFFPAHWAPNDLLLYSGRQFPARYRGGAFIAFHGSWNRAPGPQGGYNVVFVPFANGKPAGSYEIFADGFAGAERNPGAAAHRPAGLAVGPDGALYISDDAHGRIWRIAYTGAAPAPRAPSGVTVASASSADSVGPPEGTHPDAGVNPGGVNSSDALAGVAMKAAGVTPAMVALGDSIYQGRVAGGTCTGCHGQNATGTPLGPDLTDNQRIWGDGSLASITRIIREGVPAPKEHTGVMPPMGGAQLTPAQLAAVGGYIYSLSHSAGQ